MLLRKHKTIILMSVALTIVLAVSGCSTEAPAANPAGPEFEIDAFTVSLEKAEPDDVAQILGINRWKFTLRRETNEEIGLEAYLTITSPDGTSEVIDELRIFTTEREVEGMVAIYPLGESLLRADQIRVYMQLGSGSTSGVMPNPFRQFSSSYIANPADILQDGELRLMAFSDNDPMPGPENTILALQLAPFVE